jgi:hypothetical protein
LKIKTILLVIERLMLTLWVGSLCAVGSMVAPVLFATLEDRALAGSIAGKLFTLTALLGLVCGSILLIAMIVRSGRYDWRAWLVTAMLVLVAGGQFILAPLINNLRMRGLTDHADFSMLHGLAGLLFLLTAVLGLVLVAAGRARSG